MSITIIYTNAEGSTMSNTFSFYRNLDQKDFDNMVLTVQQTVNNMPLNNLNTSEGVTNSSPVVKEESPKVQEYKPMENIQVKPRPVSSKKAA
jgi:hypothetical protein